ncbi:MAG: hypothetical protein BWY59_02175 [Verrucomicrobia bacterium ADurb.Bin345]|nr:MAG: hypothetical protein BWY59_02175 [Verrucomicrobia bacterium ADurb.Bin345]
MPGIDYATGSEAPDPGELVKRMEEAARDALGGPPDVWHFHNHSMGKNCALTRAVSLLAGRGSRVLLQLHDFPEDGRPHLFRGLIEHLGGGRIEALGPLMYPQAPHIHYATINGRDKRLLERIGVEAGRLHLLPNAVTLDGGPHTPWDPRPGGSRLVLYPVRAIRRKNLGELLLWATLAGSDERFAVTLAPKSPADRIAYERWTAFARQEKLAVEFEVGTRGNMSFEQRLNSAWLAISTSVAEGFGLTFLEPWLVNRPVMGRRIPDITRDFEEAGVDLSMLYDKLLVPVEWVGRERLRGRIREVYGKMLATYGRMARPGDEERALEAAVSGDRVDFGRLDEELQELVLLRLRESDAHRTELQPDDFRQPDAALRAMDHNANIIRRTYSLERYGTRLMEIYRAVADSPAGEVNDGLNVAGLLDAFLAPERFSLLRT